jgi:hypothetical protein|tara:strand:- start:277 stop:417 length:141 start_codon:yes stop_codon:yes gene_type:complete
MPKNIDKEVLVSVEDAGTNAKKEYESFINKQEEDLDNEELSKEDEE